MTPPLSHHWPHVLLLTGPAGSGKSSFAAAFRQLGVPCFEMDQVARVIAADASHPASRAPDRPLQPWVLAEAQRWSRAQGALYVVWESALPPVAASGAERVLAIDASETVRLARIGPANAAMLSLQPARTAYLACADDVIVNEGAPEGIAAIAAQLHQHYQTLWSQE